MRTTNNVLILGAGASMPYGFPSGGKLKAIALSIKGEKDDSVCNYTNLSQLGAKAGFTKSDIEYFLDALGRATLSPSLDHFIETSYKDPDIAKLKLIAKAITALCIARFEKEKNPIGDWYLYLLQMMSRSYPRFEDFLDNRLAIITFNYDRSLEEFLLIECAKHFNISSKKMAESLATSLSIVHVHGWLGNPWDTASKDYLQYGKVNDSRDVTTLLVHSVERIKMITDNITDDDKEFSKARQMIKDADQIHFLGLGYHDSNMLRLGFNLDDQSTISPYNDKLFGTFYHVDPGRKREVIQAYRIGTFTNIGNSNNVTVEDYLKTTSFQAV